MAQIYSTDEDLVLVKKLFYRSRPGFRLIMTDKELNERIDQFIQSLYNASLENSKSLQRLSTTFSLTSKGT